MNHENAILMAAGMGSRMRPLTDHIAKPLVRVAGRPLIETVIDALELRGVDTIFVVTGYKAEQFEPLKIKYPNLKLVHNPNFETRNNIGSIATVAKEMSAADCFVCEADLFISNPSLLNRELVASGYFSRMVPGSSDDWVFDFDGHQITGIHKHGVNAWNMVGVSWFKQADAARIAKACVSALASGEADSLFWDEIVDRLLPELKLTIHEVNAGDIVECDTVADLEALERRLKCH